MEEEWLPRVRTNTSIAMRKLLGFISPASAYSKIQMFFSFSLCGPIQHTLKSVGGLPVRKKGTWANCREPFSFRKKQSHHPEDVKELNIRHLQLLYWQLPFHTDPLVFKNFDVPPDVLNKRIRSDLLRKEARQSWGSVYFVYKTTKRTKNYRGFHRSHFSHSISYTILQHGVHHSIHSVLLSSSLFFILPLISFLRFLGSSATLLQMGCSVTVARTAWW